MDVKYLDCMFGDDPPAPKPGENGKPKTFTQEEVNAMLADNKRGLQSENDKLKQQLKDQMNEREAFEQMIVEAAEEQGLNPDDFDEDGAYHGPDLDEEEEDDDPAAGEGEDDGVPRGANPPEVERIVRGLTKKFDRQLQSMQQALDKEKQARQTAEEAGILKERDAMLASILNNLDVVDSEGAKRFFLPQLEYDADTGSWLYEMKDGLRVAPEKGIADELPTWLKKPQTTGGAGSRPGSTQNLGRTRVAELEEKFKAAEAEARKNPGSPEVVQAFSTARREYEAAKKQVTAA